LFSLSVVGATVYVTVVTCHRHFWNTRNTPTCISRYVAYSNAIRSRL